jgi:hypothetical protein
LLAGSAYNLDTKIRSKTSSRVVPFLPVAASQKVMPSSSFHSWRKYEQPGSIEWGYVAAVLLVSLPPVLYSLPIPLTLSVTFLSPLSISPTRAFFLNTFPPLEGEPPPPLFGIILLEVLTTYKYNDRNQRGGTERDRESRSRKGRAWHKGVRRERRRGKERQRRYREK